MPRLAVLFVLSAASSPCPDLNLLHYKNRLRIKSKMPSERFRRHFLSNKITNRV
ncbi:hypothetical protein NEILACOT_03297 [Neisseria lactamica ATCC 23970]|uniref:Uncharacterized protein n=1 Tax=Neisseria lactamica ATCC 23970 TaxID=546265 RepID=D0W705_NEILA|nr:hypothetical protein NEILACOT_03297 [Neisseria lactamica ATCC 23970]